MKLFEEYKLSQDADAIASVFIKLLFDIANVNSPDVLAKPKDVEIVNDEEKGKVTLLYDDTENYFFITLDRRHNEYLDVNVKKWFFDSSYDLPFKRFTDYLSSISFEEDEMEMRRDMMEEIYHYKIKWNEINKIRKKVISNKFGL